MAPLWQIFIFWDPMTPLYKSKDTLATNLVTFSLRIKSFEISGHPYNKSSSFVIHNVFICWLSQLTTHLCNPPYHWEEPIVWWSAQNPVVFVSLRIIFAFNALKIGKKCWLTNMSAEKWEKKMKRGIREPEGWSWGGNIVKNVHT